MTGIEWESCGDPSRMVKALYPRGVSDRKWRLFLAEFWRWQAGKLASADELFARSVDMEYWAEVGKLPKGQRPSRSRSVVFFNKDAFESVCRTVEAPIWIGGRSDATTRQCEILRELFGNPFRRPAMDLRWFTSDVVDVARGIYADRAFERLPILADALMDAGCEDERIIGHCRADTAHVRGCWLLDLVLSKN